MEPYPLSATVQGFRRLPDELRLKILGHAFSEANAIDHVKFTNLLETRLLPFLVSEYAGIATEAFYTNNTFDLLIHGNNMIPGGFRYPKPSVQKHIRTIKLSTVSTQFSTPYAWPLIKRFCDGEFGFANICEVEIFVPTDMFALLCRMSDVVDIKVRLPIRRLLVTYKHDSVVDSLFGTEELDRGWHLQCLYYPRLHSKIYLGATKGNTVEKKLEQFHTLSETLEEMEKTPGDDEYIRYIRITQWYEGSDSSP
ncbi:hypothetical protein P280DRAFT_484337 [Massarina eburnea CBS 473.64]|uniref:Uncharacterized protein n=1 Tax=Massarina eburnea CBS 473.64 TaxID=1395130 RepID=A0A6A6RJY7_9PLEO|nr:hypothetical protein P280DRAFT_484337 [Massarina eburnea CBS 473.64]